jgi:hypothetical protein
MVGLSDCNDFEVSHQSWSGAGTIETRSGSSAGAPTSSNRATVSVSSVRRQSSCPSEPQSSERPHVRSRTTVMGANKAPMGVALNSNVASRRSRQSYLEVGIANSGPFTELSGQRCIIDFCLV